MTQLMKQRPWAVWCLFLAGAITGGIASSLMEPQRLWAEPTDLNGQKFEDLQQLVEAHDQLLEEYQMLLSGISRDESGAFVFSDPLRSVELLGPVKIELLDELEDTPALSVLGPVKIEQLDELQAAPAVSVRGPVKIESLDENQEDPVLAVRGPVALANTLGETTVVANAPLSNYAFQVHAPVDDPTVAVAEFVGDMHLFGSETIVLPEEHPGPALDARTASNWGDTYRNSTLVRFGGPTVWTGPDANLRARIAADEFSMENSALGLKTCLNSIELLVKCGQPDFGRFGVNSETGETELIVDDAIIRNAGPF